MAWGPLADLVGLNVVGMRRRGFSKTDIHSLRAAYHELFLGPGVFRERLEKIAKSHGNDPLVAGMISFIQGGKRPLTMAAASAVSGETSPDPS
jgi:UDP-N-acetylglucosamine acyltransferase